MTPEREERRLAAIPAADIVGFSRLLEADEPDIRSISCDGSPLTRTHDEYGSDHDPYFATSVDSKRRKTAKNDG